jgi:hypothetical protein
MFTDFARPHSSPSQNTAGIVLHRSEHSSSQLSDSGMLVVIVRGLSQYEMYKPACSVRARVTTTHGIDRRDRCVPPPSRFTSPNMYFTTSRTNVTTISLPIGRADGGSCTCLTTYILCRKLIYSSRPASSALIVNNRWKRMQFTKRIYIKIKRQTAASHETIVSYLHILVVLSYMRFWSRELQTPIFFDTFVF